MGNSKSKYYQEEYNKNSFKILSEGVDKLLGPYAIVVINAYPNEVFIRKSLNPAEYNDSIEVNHFVKKLLTTNPAVADFFFVTHKQDNNFDLLFEFGPQMAVPFEKEKHVWVFIQTIIEALSFMEKCGMHYPMLSRRYILSPSRKIYKLINPYCFPDFIKEVLSIYMNPMNQISNRKAYSAQQLRRNIAETGILLLSCINPRCDEFQAKKDPNYASQCLNAVSKNYSPALISLVGELISPHQSVVTVSALQELVKNMESLVSKSFFDSFFKTNPQNPTQMNLSNPPMPPIAPASITNSLPPPNPSNFTSNPNQNLRSEESYSSIPSTSSSGINPLLQQIPQMKSSETQRGGRQFKIFDDKNTSIPVSQKPEIPPIAQNPHAASKSADSAMKQNAPQSKTNDSTLSKNPMLPQTPVVGPPQNKIPTQIQNPTAIYNPLQTTLQTAPKIPTVQTNPNVLQPTPQSQIPAQPKIPIQTGPSNPIPSQPQTTAETPIQGQPQIPFKTAPQTPSTVQKIISSQTTNTKSQETTLESAPQAQKLALTTTNPTSEEGPKPMDLSLAYKEELSNPDFIAKNFFQTQAGQNSKQEKTGERVVPQQLNLKLGKADLLFSKKEKVVEESKIESHPEDKLSVEVVGKAQESESIPGRRRSSANPPPLPDTELLAKSTSSNQNMTSYFQKETWKNEVETPIVDFFNVSGTGPELLQVLETSQKENVQTILTDPNVDKKILPPELIKQEPETPPKQEPPVVPQPQPKIEIIQEPQMKITEPHIEEKKPEPTQPTEVAQKKTTPENPPVSQPPSHEHEHPKQPKEESSDNKIMQISSEILTHGPSKSILKRVLMRWIPELNQHRRFLEYEDGTVLEAEGNSMTPKQPSPQQPSQPLSTSLTTSLPAPNLAVSVVTSPTPAEVQSSNLSSSDPQLQVNADKASHIVAYDYKNWIQMQGSAVFAPTNLISCILFSNEYPPALLFRTVQPQENYHFRALKNQVVNTVTSVKLGRYHQIEESYEGFSMEEVEGPPRVALEEIQMAPVTTTQLGSKNKNVIRAREL